MFASIIYVLHFSFLMNHSGEPCQHIYPTLTLGLIVPTQPHDVPSARLP
jgi:hypothetical protein